MTAAPQSFQQRDETLRRDDCALRGEIADAIREYCHSVSPAAVQDSHGVERIYYAGISLDGLADAIFAAVTSPSDEPEEITGAEMDAIEAAAIAGKPLTYSAPIPRAWEGRRKGSNDEWVLCSAPGDLFDTEYRGLVLQSDLDEALRALEIYRDTNHALRETLRVVQTGIPTSGQIEAETETLLPCPFCGGKASHGYNGPGDGSGVMPAIFCASCSASVEGATFGIAIVRWNGRRTVGVAQTAPDHDPVAFINTRLADLEEANAIYGKDQRLGAPDKIARNDREISWLKDLRSMLRLTSQVTSTDRDPAEGK
jgi:hypothetical protein